MLEMEATAANLQTWSEVKNNSPELHVVADITGQFGKGKWWNWNSSEHKDAGVIGQEESGGERLLRVW